MSQTTKIIFVVITYERIKRVIAKEGYHASMKYYKVDYVETNHKMYYEYADELLYYIRELVDMCHSLLWKILCSNFNLPNGYGTCPFFVKLNLRN
jgi:hypothetical protein